MEGQSAARKVIISNNFRAIDAVNLMVIGLSIRSLPVGSDEVSSLINDFNRFHLLDANKMKKKDRDLGERGDQWTEVLSSEPRVPIYHNFLDIENVSGDQWTEPEVLSLEPRVPIYHNFLDNENERGDQWAEVLSSEPRVSIYHNFLSKEECEHLIKVARPYLKRSLVSDAVTGQGKESSARTSYGTFLTRGGDKVIRAIEKRIADHTLIPIADDSASKDLCNAALMISVHAENGEGLQVLRYQVGQKHDPHFDYSVKTSKNGGPRKATLLMYLSDVEQGGETVFPKAKRDVSSKAGMNGTSECAKAGISVKPKMGNAVLFWSSRPDTTLDPLSLHGSNPVIKGDKWACTKWLHETEFKI